MPSKQPTAGAAIEPPRLPPKLEARESLELLEDMGVYNGLLIASCDLSGQSAEDVTFEAAQLKHVGLGGTQLRALQLHDVRLDACDLAAALWERALLSRVEVLGCRMAGWRASQGSLRNVLFKGCSAIGAQFSSSSFKQVRFENCVLRDADFQGADLSGVVFEKCDLSNARMSEAKLVGADLRGSTIEGVRLSLKELQGAIVDMDQAISVARMLGIVVKLD